MAVTRYGLTGPMTAYGTFQAKAEGASLIPRLMLLGAGCWLLWALVFSS